jgi:predicted MFS family arabinose efflux permease
MTPAQLSVSPPQTSAARAIFAGLCASLVGIGLARFAYTPLIPSLIGANWFSAKDVIYLGAANLVGYLAGALSGRPLAHRLTARRTLQIMMLLVSLAFFACAFPLSVSWFFAWRFASGLAGGIIMVLAASTVLPHVPGERKGLASGAIFLGLGLGIAGSGTLVPLLLHLGLRETWLGLGALSLALTALSWGGWPHAAVGTAAPAAKVEDAASAPTASGPAPIREGGILTAMNVLYAQYALMAIGLVPMMVFLVDFVARGLNWGTQTASLFWVVYGVGAIAGPMLYGAAADHFGLRATTFATLAAQMAAAALLVLSNSHAVLLAATFVIGTFPPGIVPLTLGRVHRALPHDHQAQNAAWSRATTIFALFQALAGYGYSYLFARSGGDHRLLLAIGGWALAVALLAELALAWSQRRAKLSAA